MKSSEDPARTVPATGVWEGFGQTRRAAVPIAGCIGALFGVVVGYFVGRRLGHDRAIFVGTSGYMPPAIVETLGGGLGWLIGAVVSLIAYRHRPPPGRAQSRRALMAAAGFISAGLFLSLVVPTFQDAYHDPRMVYLQRLIWVDAGLAGATCLAVGWHRSSFLRSLALISVFGVAAAIVSVATFLSFLDACEPYIRSGVPCNTRY